MAPLLLPEALARGAATSDAAMSEAAGDVPREGEAARDAARDERRPPPVRGEEDREVMRDDEREEAVRAGGARGGDV